MKDGENWNSAFLRWYLFHSHNLARQESFPVVLTTNSAHKRKARKGDFFAICENIPHRVETLFLLRNERWGMSSLSLVFQVVGEKSPALSHNQSASFERVRCIIPRCPGKVTVKGTSGSSSCHLNHPPALRYSFHLLVPWECFMYISCDRSHT